MAAGSEKEEQGPSEHTRRSLGSAHAINYTDVILSIGRFRPHSIAVNRSWTFQART